MSFIGTEIGDKNPDIFLKTQNRLCVEKMKTEIEILLFDLEHKLGLVLPGKHLKLANNVEFSAIQLFCELLDSFCLYQCKKGL